MTQISILFLGASRLVELLRRFEAAAAEEGVELQMVSVEDNAPWHAIAAHEVCRVVPGARFDEPAFDGFLLDLVAEAKIDVVIPNVDGAIQAVCRVAESLQDAGVLPLVSSPELCEVMRDKSQARLFAAQRDIPVADSPSWPRLAKPRFGSSSRGHIVFQDEDELQFWEARNRAEDYVIEPFLSGVEFSIDAYVDSSGETVGAVSRTRDVVAAGEVMVTTTRSDQAVLEIADQILAWAGWFGPLNIQLMKTDDGVFFIEVNPRFGSGVTCSIEAGLDIPRLILRERLRRPLKRVTEWRSGLCMTRSRRDAFVWLS